MRTEEAEEKWKKSQKVKPVRPLRLSTWTLAWNDMKTGPEQKWHERDQSSGSIWNSGGSGRCCQWVRSSLTITLCHVLKNTKKRFNVHICKWNLAKCRDGVYAFVGGVNHDHGHGVSHGWEKGVVVTGQSTARSTESQSPVTTSSTSSPSCTPLKSDSK